LIRVICVNSWLLLILPRRAGGDLIYGLIGGEHHQCAASQEFRVDQTGRERIAAQRLQRRGIVDLGYAFVIKKNSLAALPFGNLM
jgi:hypothetical protein